MSAEKKQTITENGFNGKVWLGFDPATSNAIYNSSKPKMLQNGNNVILIRPYTLCYSAQMVAHAILSCFQLKTNMMFNCKHFQSLFLIENNLHFKHIRFS